MFLIDFYIKGDLMIFINVFILYVKCFVIYIRGRYVFLIYRRGYVVLYLWLVVVWFSF